ncbi:electron transport complex protein RnfA [Povalibacter uvarum]|uniref:Electron transport complex protein RnfA n=1 Tax=Povalibacter uvarum TaxID=732238 RepID=A0A841HGD5_9GAMM|nr:Rnf-Nqr domain containing protein [Povalibacter uvarum]MBB6091410.1 electron transport complex protein RnfA [Povalibacter uvarum]
MSSLLLILLSAVLVCHYAPALTGLRAFEQTDEFDATTGIAVGSLALLSVVAPLGYALERLILEPFALGYLRTFALVILILLLAQILSSVMARSSRWTPVQPMFTLLMTSNSAVLGVALLSTGIDRFSNAVWAGIGLGILFALLLLAFTTLQQRIRQANAPAAFRDAPLALITTGLMALSLMGLIGILGD